MTYLEAYDAASDFIHTCIEAAWPEISEIHEGRVSEIASQFAYYELSGAVVANQSPTIDEVSFTFVVLGVWPNDRDAVTPIGREIFKAGKASSLHLALSQDSDGTDKIYSPQVVSIENSDFIDDAASERLAVSVMFTCMATLDRQ